MRRREFLTAGAILASVGRVFSRTPGTRGRHRFSTLSFDRLPLQTSFSASPAPELDSETTDGTLCVEPKRGGSGALGVFHTPALEHLSSSLWR